MHSAISLFYNPIFAINRVTGIGNDWLPKIIFSMIPGKNDFNKEQPAITNGRNSSVRQN